MCGHPIRPGGYVRNSYLRNETLDSGKFLKEFPDSRPISLDTLGSPRVVPHLAAQMLNPPRTGPTPNGSGPYFACEELCPKAACAQSLGQIRGQTNRTETPFKKRPCDYGLPETHFLKKVSDKKNEALVKFPRFLK